MYSLLWMWHQSHCCHSEPPVSPGSECQGLSVISILKVRFSIAHVHTVFHCHCFVDKRPDLQDQWSTEVNSISSYLLNYWLFSPHNCFWILKIKAIPFQVSLYSQESWSGSCEMLMLLWMPTWTGGTSQEARRPLPGAKAMLFKIFSSRKPSPPAWQTWVRQYCQAKILDQWSQYKSKKL